MKSPILSNFYSEIISFEVDKCRKEIEELREYTRRQAKRSKIKAILEAKSAKMKQKDGETLL